MMVPNEPLREAFIRSRRTAYSIARDLDWPNGKGYDSSRVRRTLGLVDEVNGIGKRSTRQTVDERLALQVGDALGLDPWEIGL